MRTTSEGALPWTGLACAALTSLGSSDALSLSQPVGSQLYTTNAACSKNRCVNPVFPGLESLHTLAESQWHCSTLKKTAEAMSFCRSAINYDPALKTQTAIGQSLEDRVRQQDAAASEDFFYHLAGLGLESWDYNKPELSNDECIKSIWRMVCYTHFPRAQVGCIDGTPSQYVRPCKSSCQSYVRQCGVECCDEGVQCVFSHTKPVKGALVKTEGYVPMDGPSSTCTGAASRSAALGCLPVLLMLSVAWSWFDGVSGSPAQARAASRRGSGAPRSYFKMSFVSAVVFALIPVSPVSALQAEIAREQTHQKFIPTHQVANWRSEPDYLIKFEFIPPGGSAITARMNSCSLDMLPTMLKCSGRGLCQPWQDDGHVTGHPAMFCQCDRDWADPECRTRRKSQATAFWLSLFLGMFGADQFYLGYVAQGFVKLFTFGGFGIWWAVDIIRIGSAPVHTPSFRVAADFPHWAFALVTITFAMLLGFTIAYFLTITHRAKSRREQLLMQAEEDKLLWESKAQKIKETVKSKDKVRHSNLRSYQADTQSPSGFYSMNRPGFHSPRFAAAPMPQSVVL
eukprot:TRINITY_DN121591_c0_g1_i1.p1 TRINITY_DN121591_c0_g1~~TRINITY_DN121591_c0_g1_i1.p1  ORF type:complete len:569 (-),score=91.45 TRINITY_DN121591_c0_g1_i1:121-1827(-)